MTTQEAGPLREAGPQLINFYGAQVVTLAMLPQKLSRISFKMSDLEEYEEMKRKKAAADKVAQSTPSAAAASPIAKSTRKALSFGTTGDTPVRSSTPETD